MNSRQISLIFYTSIQSPKQEHTQEIWGNLCKEKAVLAEYEKVVHQVGKTQGYRNEQLQKTLQIIAVRITNDSCLLNQLQRDLPNVATKILSQAQVQLDRARSY